jgi:signal transduction histidine kinase
VAGRGVIESTTHEIANLLGVILNYATLMGRDLTDPVAAGDLSRIRTAAERAVELTRQLAAGADG